MLIWVLKPFSALSLSELYAALKARQQVFVVEQHCAYLDLDDCDQMSHHLFGFDEAHQLAAYCRLVPPCIKFTEPSIGRVLTLPSVRGKGYGKALMHTAISHIQQLYPRQPIRIGAQLYLERFYNTFGFVRASLPYDEDGIAHIEMLRAADA
ncbi:MAG: GNAT family N-acetyltransferase [Chloroherpetonaceae bacterium]|nr:GNAT family N-acetyltransferase [Chloroherpetonaceae bacterium]MCS7212005.1 GNAT family N-acetyltransferase [Chloroherpetonaceae bacterium]MDW8019131.1 GNAT family N-acetyltransferase [Chloroherpetonaceae bacterium]MDW8466924.1 GNAT family N-acetyltransferase [Chloroherpetonaceae bacterium]